ncbi:hypothetical protein F4553_003972 [Allocatelliglobosispora scoriae]|uniref:Uncharacterized protein n=1 Tax=Allocatelliglobosispora scoriae TaxID=643052 RepID=A0A841BUK4_9ACTN|nr:hypothetical protein [Allocatelliglobosispora scoriae]MBB5870593.1 hypothetical protein [Allocatelliglobosispora scoriae]
MSSKISPTHDPFEGLEDEKPADGFNARKSLLDSAKRGFVPIRKVFVQKAAGSDTRASLLSDLVRGRQERSLDAFLLIHALEPVAATPIPLARWAQMLSSARKPCTSSVASRALDALVNRKLITRDTSGRKVVVKPLLEDGSGEPWARPGRDPAKVGKGYFTIPHEYWTSGLADELELAGKAMFLVILAETTQNPTFSMAVERAHQWYGFSERTAERGYQQLRDARVAPETPLLREHRQMVAEPRSSIGLRPVWHRALADPYGMTARAKLQASTGREARNAGKVSEIIKIAVEKRQGTKTTITYTKGNAPVADS